MSPVPVIDVFHLPSSASFYAAICQPLGIYYLSCTPAQRPSSASSSLPRSPTLHFGIPSSPGHPDNEILFTLRESPNPIRSILTIDAFSPSAVTRFHARALAANIIRSTNLIQHNPEESIAKTTDLDGNMVEAKYDSRRSAGGGRIWETAATPKEARRVLDWQKDVARNVNASKPLVEVDDRDAASVISGRSAPASRLGRKETISTYQYQPREPARAERLVSGMSNQALVGSLLGAAAGAAIAYAMVKSEEPAPRAGLERRNTLPERPKMVKYYHHSAPGRVVEIESARSRRGGSESGSMRSGRNENGQLVRYHVRGGEAGLAGIDEERSVNHRSQAAREERRTSGSVVSRSSKHSHSSSRSHRDRETTVLPPLPESRAGSRTDRDGKSGGKSSRSVASEGSSVSTVRPKSKYHASAPLTTNSRSGGRDVERRSTVSARMVPLPESVAGSSVGRRGGVARTVVPSDSISNIGMREDSHRKWVWR